MHHKYAVSGYFCFLSMLLSNCLWAQLMPPLSLFRESLSLINPAAASHNYTNFELPFTVSAGGRLQFVGLDNPEEQPLFGFINGEAVFKGKNQVGLQIQTNKTGQLGNLSIHGRYAYHLEPITSRGEYIFSLGLNVGAVQNYSRVVGATVGDISDIDIQPYSTWLLDFGFGGYMAKKDLWYGGISASSLFSDRMALWAKRGEYSLSGLPTTYQLFGGGYFELNKSSLVEPTFLLRYSKYSRLFMAGNVRVKIDKLPTVALGITNRRVVNLQLGFLLEIGDAHLNINLASDLLVFSRYSGLGMGPEIFLSDAWDTN